MPNPKNRETVKRVGGALLAVSAALAASALYAQYRTRQVERANPPTGDFIDIDRVRLHYIDRGEGPPVVLVHGNGSMINDFAISTIVDTLAQTNRVIVFDRPGYGYSDRPEFRNFDPRSQAALLRRALLRLHVEDPVIVGHSWGALIAVWMGIMHPNAIRGLVLISGYYYPTLRLDVPILSLPAVPYLGAFLRYTISPVLSRAMWPLIKRRIFGPRGPTKAFDSNYPIWMGLRPGAIYASASETAMLRSAASELAPQFARLKVPVTLVAGENDMLVSTRAQTQRLHKALRTSTMRIVKGAGHMVHHEAPDEVVLAIRSALAAPTPRQLQQVSGAANTTAHDLYGRHKGISHG
jgi:pimeloyl-ACP methyl ester carboxylesterase